jgi:hypothetical protein
MTYQSINPATERKLLKKFDELTDKELEMATIATWSTATPRPC